MNIEEAIQILELGTSVPTVMEIKSAFRKLAKKYHPDLTGNIDTSDFIRIETAYNFLIQNLSELGHLSNNEKEDIENYHSKIYINEFITIINQLYNDYIGLPRIMNETVRRNEFYNLLDNLFSLKVIESIKKIKNEQKIFKLIDLLITVTSGNSFLARRKFLKKILPIANDNKKFKRMLNGAIYELSPKFFGSNSFESEKLTTEPSQENFEDQQNFVYSSKEILTFLDAFDNHQKRPYVQEDLYEDTGRSFRESYREVKNKDAGTIVFKELVKLIKSNNIEKLSVSFKELEFICQLLAIISNLGDFLKGKDISTDLGFTKVIFMLFVEKKLSGANFRILLELFRYYLPNRNKFPNLIKSTLKFDDYAQIFKEMFIIYEIALHSGRKFSFEVN